MLKSLKDNWKLALFGVLVLHLFLLLRLGFTAWPETLLWPYLMDKGWLPYQSIAIAHTPLMLIDLTIFYKLFGVSISSLQAFTYALVLLLDIVVYFVARKLWDKKVALVSVFVFALWQIFFQGNGLWFDMYMGLLALLSFYSVKKKDWLWAGIFWGAAFLSKQTAFWFLGPIGLALLGKGFFEKTKKFLIGVLIIFVPSVLIFKYFGILQDFIYWAFRFGVTELPRAQGQIQYPTLRMLAIALFPFSVFVPAILKRKERVNLAPWAFAGVLGAYPRFDYFHFQAALPYLGFAAALFFKDLKKKEVLAYLFVGLYLAASLRLFFVFARRDWKKETRFFDERTRRVAEVVKEKTKKDEKIFVLNYWDNIYALTDTLPANDPWVPHLPWYMELEGTQEDIVSDLEEVKPNIVVAGTYSETGLSSYRPKLVDEYIGETYVKVDSINGVNILEKK